MGRVNVLCVLAVLAVTGCAHTSSGGITVRKAHWEKTSREIRPRATMHLACPDEQIELTLLQRVGRAPVLVRADGCGRSALYSKLRAHDSDWELEAEPSARPVPHASASTAAVGRSGW